MASLLFPLLSEWLWFRTASTTSSIQQTIISLQHSAHTEELRCQHVHSTPSLIILLLRGLETRGERWRRGKSRALWSVCCCCWVSLLAAAAVWAFTAVMRSEEREGKGEQGGGEEEGADDVCKYSLCTKIHYSALFFCTDTNQIQCAQVFFLWGLLSIVSLAVFAERCDLGQGLRETINNSEHVGAVFRANFLKWCHFFNAQGERGAWAASNEDNEASVQWTLCTFVNITAQTFLQLLK